MFLLCFFFDKPELIFLILYLYKFWFWYSGILWLYRRHSGNGIILFPVVPFFIFFPQFPSLLIFLIWEYHFKKQTAFVSIFWARIFHTRKVFTLLDLIELPILPSLKSLNFWKEQLILCYSNHVQVGVAIGWLAHETK